VARITNCNTGEEISLSIKEKTKEILIVGTGALACFFAAKLSAAGYSITMLGTWKEGLAALRQHGVTLVKKDGKQTSFEVNVTDNPANCIGIKNAIVLVKSWQTERAAKQLSECLPEDGVALTLQNGLGNLELLSTYLGDHRVGLGVTTTGATLLSSGRVRPGGDGIVSIGEFDKLNELIESIQLAGFKVEQLKNVAQLIWGKLVVNAAINPLTALLKMPNGKLLTRASAQKLSNDLANEVAAVASAQGISLSFDDPIKAVNLVSERTAENYSSMYQDILRGAPTEINSICGEIVKHGEKYQVPTPVNYTMWRLINAAVEGNIEDETS
jgi:2-dehydropantoate 2-reductase